MNLIQRQRIAKIKSQTELQHVETVIDKSQINQFKKVAILENELEHCVSVNNNLNSQLLGITQEIQQAHQKANALELACHVRDVELVEAKAAVKKLQEEVGEKALQLEQYKTLNAQSSEVTPGTRSRVSTSVDKLQNKESGAFMPNALHHHCPMQVAPNNSELNHIKATLEDLQADQQKIAMIVSHLYHSNRIQPQDTTNGIKTYPSFSFNPYMGNLDTGQNFHNYNRFNHFQPFSQLKAM